MAEGGPDRLGLAARAAGARRRMRALPPCTTGSCAAWSGLTDMPARGADFFLIDRAAIDAFRRCDERNVSVLALVTWLGFRQAQVEYDKQPRAAGRSGWTLGRKVALVADSVTAFTALPMRVCGVLGAALAGVRPVARPSTAWPPRGPGPLAVVGWITALAGAAACRAGRHGRVPVAGARCRAAPPRVFRRARGGYKINRFFDIATQRWTAWRLNLDRLHSRISPESRGPVALPSSMPSWPSTSTSRWWASVPSSSAATSARCSP